MELIKYTIFIAAVIVVGLVIALVLIGFARWTRERRVLRWSIVTGAALMLGVWIAVESGETEFQSVLAIPFGTLIAVFVLTMAWVGLDAAKGWAVAGVIRGMDRTAGKRRVRQVFAVLCWMLTCVVILGGLAGGTRGASENLSGDPDDIWTYWLLLGCLVRSG